MILHCTTQHYIVADLTRYLDLTLLYHIIIVLCSIGLQYVRSLQAQPPIRKSRHPLSFVGIWSKSVHKVK